MKSQAAKRYDVVTKIRPLKTRQRNKMYDSLQVASTRKSSSPHSPLETISRSSRDSYLLRVTKQPVLNTNYTPNTDLIYNRSKRQIIDKASFERIIGDVRDEDFSLPLVTSDKRCNKAFETLPQQSMIVNSKDLHKSRKRYENLNFDKQISWQMPLQESRQFNRQKSFKKMLSLKSTEDSYNIDRTIDYEKYPGERNSPIIHDALKKIRNFDHTSGHTYGQEISKPTNNPQPYDVASSNQAFVKKSMSNPKGYAKFDLFRDKIATRFDRLDPNWGMNLNYEDLYLNRKKDNKGVEMKKLTERKPNEVYSKYPIRQNMSFEVPKNRVE